MASTSKRSVPGLPPMASSAPAAGECPPRYSSSTGAPATKAHQTKEPPRLLGGPSVSLLICCSTGDCFVPDHGISTNAADRASVGPSACGTGGRRSSALTIRVWSVLSSCLTFRRLRQQLAHELRYQVSPSPPRRML